LVFAAHLLLTIKLFLSPEKAIGVERDMIGWLSRGVRCQNLWRFSEDVHLLFKSGQKRGLLSCAVKKRLVTMQERQEKIMEEMRSSGRTSDGLSKEHSLLSKALTLFLQRKELDEEEKSVKELLEEASGDKEMEKECLGELKRLSSEMELLDSKLVDAVLPQGTDDHDSDAVIELQAGTGGDEASLFAFELFEAYERIAKSIGFRTERLSPTSERGKRFSSTSRSREGTWRVEVYIDGRR
jgi:protein subunit release factor A